LYAQAGKRVAVVEERYVGGTCVNVGCIPKKLFANAAHFASDFQDAKRYGWQLSDAKFDWVTLRDNVAEEIARLKSIYLELLNKAGVIVINGSALLVDARTVLVDDQQYTADKILIASGSMAFIPAFAGSEHVITSNEFFSLEKLPKRAHIVGGGYIAVELASILVGLGVNVSLVYRGDLFLKNFDQEVREFLAEELRKKDIHLQFNSDILKIEKNKQQLTVHFVDNHQEETDIVIYATGRKPNTQALGLEQAGVKLNDNGAVVVNDDYQTNVDTIFAIGDVIETKALTPVAIAQAVQLTKYWQGQQTQPINYENIATTVFSQPNVGTIGLTEAEAIARLGEVEVYKSTFRALKHTVSGSSEKTFIKVIVDKSNDQVVGLHMVGSDVGEIIQGFAVAIQMGATKAQFDQTIGIHPTVAEEFVTLKK
jgi:glutathione reductase (NADPH)